MTRLSSTVQSFVGATLAKILFIFQHRNYSDSRVRGQFCNLVKKVFWLYQRCFLVTPVQVWGARQACERRGPSNALNQNTLCRLLQQCSALIWDECQWCARNLLRLSKGHCELDVRTQSQVSLTMSSFYWW